MRIVVDRDLCQGHAMCAVEAPTVFAVPADADEVTVLDETPDAGQRDGVERAVRYCPNGALSIAEERP